MARFSMLFFLFFIISAIPAGLSAANQLKITAENQASVEVTVYNNNLGLVKDVRKFELPLQQGEARFMDVASSIIPESVHIKSLNKPEGLSILEQNYEYDLMNEKKLLDKYVGRKIKIIDWNEFKDRKDTVDAVLLGNNDGQIFKINDEIYLGHPGIKVLPEIPENLISNPTLAWLYDNRSSTAHNIEVSYLTNNISWKADYIVILKKNDTKTDISGWVTLDNKSGATYKNASLKLVAGNVNIPEPAPRYKNMALAAMEPAAVRGFEEKAFFEYHIYSLQRKTTVKDKQTKQVNLLEVNDVDAKKEMLVTGEKYYYSGNYRSELPRQPVYVYLIIRNSKENNLGMPLPEGTMRVYKQDQDSSLQFIGEDRIEHTPKDENVKLKIGEAFDVVARRVQTDYREITTQLHETEWEITISNHKEEEVSVGIIEPLYGNWTITNNSHPYKKIDAFTIRFDASVPKNGEAKVKYRVRTGL